MTIAKKKLVPTILLAVYATAMIYVLSVKGATTYHASNAGAGTTCSAGSPCLLATALDPALGSPVTAGDTLIIDDAITIAGLGFTSRLVGTALAPITVTGSGLCPKTTSCTSQIVIPSGKSPANFALRVCSDYTIYTNFEIIDNAADRKASNSGPFPSNTDQGYGWVSCDIGTSHTGNESRGLVIHGVAEGIESYSQNANEKHTNDLIFDTGWNGTDNGHGHQVYTQNTNPSTKLYLANVWTSGTSLTTQVYTTGGKLDNFTIQNNIMTCPGCLDFRGVNRQGSLTAGSGDSSINLFSPTWDGNINFCGSTAPTCGSSSSDFFFGDTGSPCTGTVTVTNNYNMGSFLIGPGAGCDHPTIMTGNTLLKNPVAIAPNTWANSRYPTNTYQAGVLPTVDKTFVIPWTYTAGKCWVVVFNWAGGATKNVNLDTCLSNGVNYEIRNTQNIFAAPASTGTFTTGVSVSFPSTALSVFTPIGDITGSGVGTLLPEATGPKANVFLVSTTSGGAATPTPTATNTNTPTMTNTVTLTPSRTNTPTSTPTGTLPTNTPTNTPTLTLTPTATSTRTVTPASFSTQFAAFNCTYVAPMASHADATAIGLGYGSSTVDGVDTPASGGTFQCPFTVPSTGDYRMWVHLWAPSASQDSMYVKMDFDAAPVGRTPGPTTEVFDFAESQTYSAGPPPACVGNQQFGAAWQWNKLNNRGTDINGCTGLGAERILYGLTSGAHTVTFYGREIGARVDYILLTTDLNLNPNTLFLPTPTPGPNQCKRGYICNNAVIWRLEPCNRPPADPCTP